MMDSYLLLFSFIAGTFFGSCIIWLIQKSINKEKINITKDSLEKIAVIENKIEEKLKSLAGEALKSNQTSFFQLAKETFEKNQTIIEKENKRKEDAINNLIIPVSKTLEEYKNNLKELEKDRHEAFGNVNAELQNVIKTQIAVKNETAKLVNALKGNPKTRGRWGEETLKNVMELSGMTQYCDFLLEKSIDSNDDDKLRPDVIINLPGRRHLIIDAKTSTSAYLDSIEAEEDEEKERHLMRHVSHIRSQMNKLSAKSYWENLSVTPDFVVMFIPGDNFFSAAIERDPDLFEDAIKKKILIVTPTTLIALAKAVSYGWRQEKVAANYKQIAELGVDLYKRLSTMGTAIEALRKSISTSVIKFNEFLGNVEGMVLPQARKFKNLDIEGTNKELNEIEPIELDTRKPNKNKDLQFKSDS